jgi:single-stranded-DNA-specific exonuclease
MRWLISPVDQNAAEKLVRELSIPAWVAGLLVQRGISEPGAAHCFLHPQLHQLHDPYLMQDMRPAVQRIRQAVAAREKILIYGDYDVDGTMAVVVLLTALRSLGACVDAYIPHRLSDGYGMRVPVIEKAAAEGVRVIISVDTGIREHEVMERGREMGVACIVTDHHLPDESLPKAYAILNPRRPDCAYPEKSLAGVGVAFKLAQALLQARMTARLTESYLKIVAIGTIADVVPLLGENRVIAHNGLRGLREPSQPGLEALLEVSGLLGKPVNSGHVAFRVAPRVNAAGRMESAREVIELFTTSNPARAREIAGKLDGLNRERQLAEEGMLRVVLAEMEKHPEKARRHSLVFAKEGWHRGVIGIVAQRAAERYYRPTLVISIENGMGHGSGRSINGFHLLDALTENAPILERFGGHAQAAGFSLPAESIPALESGFEAAAARRLTAEDLEPTQRVDAQMDLEQIDQEFYDQVKNLEPFGYGNPTPVFAVAGLELIFPPRFLQEKHLKLRVGKKERSLDALAWGKAELGRNLKAGQYVDLACTVEENCFQDVRSLQLIVRDLKPG